MVVVCTNVLIPAGASDPVRLLPPGWTAADPAAFGPTRLGAFPPVTGGDGEVLLAATDAVGGGALLVLRQSDRLRADADTKDALAVAAPTVLSEAWGTPYRILWADVGLVGGRRAMQLQGSFATPGEDRVALTTWVPDGRGHHLVIGVMPASSAEDLQAVVDGVVAALPAPGGARPPATDTLVRVAVAAALLVAVALAGRLALRRRRVA